HAIGRYLGCLYADRVDGYRSGAHYYGTGLVSSSQVATISNLLGGPRPTGVLCFYAGIIRVYNFANTSKFGATRWPGTQCHCTYCCGVRTNRSLTETTTSHRTRNGQQYSGHDSN